MILCRFDTPSRSIPSNRATIEYNNETNGINEN